MKLTKLAAARRGWEFTSTEGGDVIGADKTVDGQLVASFTHAGVAGAALEHDLLVSIRNYETGHTPERKA